MKMLLFLIRERSIGEIRRRPAARGGGVVLTFSHFLLSSQFGPLALQLGDTCFPTLHKSPPINFEKSGTCNYDLKLN